MMTDSSKQKTRKAHIARTRRMTTLAGLLPQVTRPVSQRYPMKLSSLILRWAELVGEDWAARCSPAKISYPYQTNETGRKGKGAKLFLSVHSADAPRVQHAIPLLLARINTALGQNSVTHIKLIHASPDQMRVSVNDHRKTPIYTKDQSNRFDEELDLESVLKSYGRAIKPKG